MRFLWKLIKILLPTIILLPIISLFLYKYYNPIITITQINEEIHYNKLDREYISYDDMGDNIKLAVIASEDQNFFSHNGFDMKAIQQALIDNEEGKKLRGGSTISQQTAKNIFLWQGRSWIRKGLEVPFTYAIEKLWGKHIILERYLNSIEMGQGVFGIEAASLYYFGKSAKNLTKSEAAWIVCVLPNPKKYDPDNPTPRLIRKHKWILRQMKHIKLTPKDENQNEIL